MRHWGVIAACLLAAACGSAGKKAAVDDARLAAAVDEAGSWLTHGGTYEEQRYSRLDAVNTDTVAKLGLAWSHTFDTNRGQEATPIVADGVLYTTSAWSKVYAFDAKTGALAINRGDEIIDATLVCMDGRPTQIMQPTPA